MEKWQKDKNNVLQEEARQLRRRIKDLTPDQLDSGEHLALAVEVTNMAIEFEKILKANK